MVHEWLLWGESQQANGFTGLTSKAAWPDTYTYTGDTITVRDLKAGGKQLQPYLMGGMSMHVTKGAGARIKGSKSWEQSYMYLPSLGENGTPQEVMRHMRARDYLRGELLTGEVDSANVNEISMVAALMAYGGFHKYPQDLSEVVALCGQRLAKIHEPQISITPTGTITSGSGPVTIEAASQEDYWAKTGRRFYILGFVPQLVNLQGVLQINKGVPQPGDYQLHKDAIPFCSGAPTTSFRGTKLCLPYEPIGPFGLDEQPNIGAFANVASAFTGSLLIGEIA